MTQKILNVSQLLFQAIIALSSLHYRPSSGVSIFMFPRSYRLTVALIVWAMALNSAVAIEALAQRQDGSANSTEVTSTEDPFPHAVRQTPSLRASLRMQSRLQRLFSAYEKADMEQVSELAEAILNEERANTYDKAVAHQLAAQVAWTNKHTEVAKQHLQQVIELDALNNTQHFQAMRMLAQLQLQDAHYEEGLANLERYLAESGSRNAEDLIIKGQALYHMQRYDEAIAVLENALAATDDPTPQWQALLLAAYVEAQQMDQAIALAEQLAAHQPDDKPAQINLATVYIQANQLSRATEVLERLRRNGQLDQEREYRQLYSIYAQMEGRESQVITVINEGLEKGILQADYPIYLALAQSYYYSGHIPQAIGAWQQAAPLADNGETWLNLARVLHAERRISEAKQAAQNALAKGVRDPDDANRIINLK